MNRLAKDYGELQNLCGEDFKADIIPDTDTIDTKRKHRLGMRLLKPTGGIWKYGKVDFGNLGKVDGKTLRNIQYRWFPWNVLAALERGSDVMVHLNIGR